MNVEGRLSGTDRIDPLAAGRPGQYDDGVVHVVSGPSETSLGATIVRTPHFRVHRRGHQVRISHDFRPDQLDNDLAGMLAEELFAPGWLSGADVFERAFTGIIKTTVDEPLHAWSTFYDNTLRRLHDGWNPGPGAHAEHSSIAGILPVYRKVAELVPRGRVLDIGCCFGFLALLLAERAGTRVVATDISHGTVSLLRTIARERGVSIGTLVCDGARIPLPDHAVDTVTVIHLLEHLDLEHGRAVLSEALRLARVRVIVAVPFEEEPTAAYGHVRTFDLEQLAKLGESTGQSFHLDEHHGGWLVLDC